MSGLLDTAMDLSAENPSPEGEGQMMFVLIRSTLELLPFPSPTPASLIFGCSLGGGVFLTFQKY